VSFLSYLFAFVLLLSILIFVHELGHFLVARACGVRVLKFSMGFGPPIGFGRYRLAWKSPKTGTEFVFAWFPLGGFVKMLGENPDEVDDPEALAHPGESLGSKRTWQKLAIVFAGPVMNLLLPVAVFMGTLAIGMPRQSAVVGSVEPGSPAAEAGLAPGDRIAAIAGREIAWWGDFDEAVREAAGSVLRVRAEREGAARELEVPVATRASFDELGRAVEVGWIGTGHRRASSMLGVARADAPAQAAGLRSGDVVTSVGETAVESWEDLAAAYAAAGRDGRVSLSLRRAGLAPAGAAPDEETLRVEVPALGDLDALGVVPASVLVDRVEPMSPAEAVGLEAGDLILAVNGAPVGSFSTFAETVRTSAGQPLEIVYAREGKRTQVFLVPEMAKVDVGLGMKEPRYRVGIAARSAGLLGAVGTDQERNPLVSLPRAVGMTVEVTKSFLEGLGMMVTGQVSRDQLAGPIGIAEIAGNAMQAGWETYLSILVLISINLGILNLLPIPILDGGQAVLFAIEGLKRGPLSLRTREIVQQIGFTMLMLIMGLAFWNDLSRQWTRLLDWLSSHGAL